MKSIISLSLIAFIFSPICLFSQDDYFQQDVNYTIQVKLNDSLHELSAYEEIIYKNNFDLLI